MSDVEDGVEIPEHLLALLADFELALLAAGEEFWARRIAETRPAIAKGDPYAVHEVEDLSHRQRDMAPDPPRQLTPIAAPQTNVRRYSSGLTPQT